MNIGKNKVKKVINQERWWWSEQFIGALMFIMFLFQQD